MSVSHVPVLQSETSNVNFSHLKLRTPLAMAVRTWPHPESTGVWLGAQGVVLEVDGDHKAGAKGGGAGVTDS